MLAHMAQREAFMANKVTQEDMEWLLEHHMNMLRPLLLADLEDHLYKVETVAWVALVSMAVQDLLNLLKLLKLSPLVRLARHLTVGAQLLLTKLKTNSIIMQVKVPSRTLEMI